MPDSFYHITESRELNKRKKKKGPKTYPFGRVILRVSETGKSVMAILHGKQGLLYDKR